MNKFTTLSILLILFFIFSSQLKTSAQIHNIKKKSSSNKSKKSRSSSRSSSKKSSHSSSSGSDVNASEVFGCISNIFDVAGCLFSAFEKTESSNSSDYSSNDYYSNNDNIHYEPEVYENRSDETEETTKTEKTSNENITLRNNKVEVPNYIVEKKIESKNIPIDTVKSESELTLDIRANFDLSLHRELIKAIFMLIIFQA